GSWPGQYGSVAAAMAAPVATRPAASVQPPTETCLPSAPAHTSACPTGAMATGTTAIAMAVNSTAASFFISYSFFLLPAQAHRDYRAHLPSAPGKRNGPGSRGAWAVIPGDDLPREKGIRRVVVSPAP